VADFLIDRLYLVFLTNSILQRQLIIKNTKLLVGFVPSHRRRHYFVKGYNQSQLLAQKFAKKYDYSFVVMAKKFKHTKSQASLSRQDRLSNLKKTYVLNNELNLK
jgi:predicted amidophosphoribosyltransferase